MVLKFKRIIQQSLRQVHWCLAQRPLPDRLAVYFHTLEEWERANFAEAMLWIKQQGYRFVGTSEFLIATGKLCYVSFDDNFKGWHEALPLMAELGVRATFFTNTCVLRGESNREEEQRYCKVIGYRRHFTPLSRVEIRELSDAGHTIGAHTHSHISLASADPQVVEQEMALNREILEQITGRPILDMAFTFGFPRHFSEVAEAVCIRMGFKTISWATPGMLHHQGNPLRIHRTEWNYALRRDENIANLKVDGRLFVKLTGRSPIG